jgi:pimeloyl-ACP methyl ester carboxylesterase
MPLFFFHGMPGSRLFHPHDEITREMGIRLIAVERPGYGESTFQPGRRILDWPVDVAALANSLRIDTFAISGHSGGGPYALACAYSLPERVRLAVPICGAGPVEAPHATDGMEMTNRFGFQLGRYIPWPAWHGLVRLVYRKKMPALMSAGTKKRSPRPPADEALWNLLDVREHCIASEAEGFRPGLQGFAWDTRLLTRPWGFRLEDIRVPVRLWHGTADTMTPFPMARYVASHIPGCKPTFCKNEAHLLIFPHWRDILSQIIME